MATIIKTKRGLNLSLKQAENIYSCLDLHENIDSLAEQRYIRLKVSQIYETGRDDVNKNTWKAKKYLAEATSATPVKHGFWSSETVFTVLGLFSTIRSQITRLNTLLKQNFIAKAFLNRLFGIAGLSFLVELIYDLYLTTKSAYRSMPIETDMEKKSSFFKRFINRCKIFIHHFNNALDEEEGRRNRMLSYAMWGSINLTLFIVSFGASFLLNAFGYFIDVLNHYHKRSNILTMHEDLLLQVSNKLTEIKDQTFELHKKRFELLHDKKQLQNEYDATHDLKKKKEIEQILLALQQKLVTNDDCIVLLTKDQVRFEYEKYQIEKKTNEAIKERKFALTVASLVLFTVTLASIPGINVVVATAAICLLLAVTAYVTLTRLWDIGKKIGRFCLKTYHHYKESTSKIEQEVSNEPIPINQHTLSSTEKIKQDLRDNIHFLKYCREKVAKSGLIAETFSEFTPDEIQKLRKIFNLNKDAHWQEQLEKLIEHAKDDCEHTHQKIDDHLIYRCSFKNFLDNRIEQDRTFGFLLDANNRHVIDERLRKLNEETDETYEPVTHEPVTAHKFAT